MAADPQIKQAVKNGLASKTQDTRKAIAGFGQECSVEAALPSTIHLFAKYGNNLKEALVENIMAGGDFLLCEETIWKDGIRQVACYVPKIAD